MSALRPNHEFDSELLSAYVDNELTAAERAAVEARLRTDDRARQTVAELRTASEVVQALPRSASPRDFATSVLGQIERERLIIEPPPVATLPPIDHVAEHTRRRGLIYAAAAVAAAIMLMLLRPADRPPEPRQLAQSQPRRRVEAEAGAVQSKTEAAQLREEKDAAGARPGATPPTPTPSQDRDAALARDRAAPLEQERVQSDLAATTAAAPTADAPLPAAAPMSTSAPASGDASGFGGLADASRFGGARRAVVSGGAPGEVEVFDVAASGDAAAAEFEQLLAAHGIVIVDQPPPGDASQKFFDALAGPRETAEATRPIATPAGAYLIEAEPERVAALAAALRAGDGQLTFAAGREPSDARGAQGFRATAEGRGGFGGGRGGREPQPAGRAWRLSAASASGPATRDGEERADAILAEAGVADPAAAAGRFADRELATAAPHRALFVLQPEAAATSAVPAAPAAAAGEPQQ